jgi:hypothetical protein
MKLEDLLRSHEERHRGAFYGKYEGVVTDNADPLKIGRLRAKVPAVLGEDVVSGWALPCAPFGGGKDRGFLFVPEVGDTVWIEFAAGDPSRPIWVGVYWGAPESTGNQDDLGTATGTEVPTSSGTQAGPGKAILKTKAGHTLYFDDDGQLIVVANGNGKTEIHLTQDGQVTIKADKILLGDGAQKAVILGDDFMQFFNAHTHPTGVGPSGPPTQPMQSNLLSQKTFTE